jgi:hypothetical protein
MVRAELWSEITERVCVGTKARQKDLRSTSAAQSVRAPHNVGRFLLNTQPAEAL